MRDSDQEIVRQVLSSILDRLNEAAGDQITNHNGGNDNPVILVVMGQGNNNSGAQTREARDEKAKAVDRREMRATHPVFERFPIAEEEIVSPAPKTCFMEPGRVCVNSGACEMRGY